MVRVEKEWSSRTEGIRVRPEALRPAARMDGREDGRSAGVPPACAWRCCGVFKDSGYETFQRDEGNADGTSAVRIEADACKQAVCVVRGVDVIVAARREPSRDAVAEHPSEHQTAKPRLALLDPGRTMAYLGPRCFPSDLVGPLARQSRFYQQDTRPLSHFTEYNGPFHRFAMVLKFQGNQTNYDKSVLVDGTDKRLGGIV